MDSLFHWLAQPYHTPDGLHANGTFLVLILGSLAVFGLLTYAIGRTDQYRRDHPE